MALLTSVPTAALLDQPVATAKVEYSTWPASDQASSPFCPGNAATRAVVVALAVPGVCSASQLAGAEATNRPTLAFVLPPAVANPLPCGSNEVERVLLVVRLV